MINFEKTIRIALVAAAIFLGIGLHLSVLAADFYVAPVGNDANPGTAARPFASLGRARDAVRAKTMSGMGADVVVELVPGRYFNGSPIVFDERDGGKNGHEVIYRGSRENAAARIYGGVPVTGWERWKGDIWRAPVPKGARFYNLIVDGRPATMAQRPKAGSGYGGGALGAGNGGVGVPKEWMGYDYSDAQVFCFIGGNWFSEMRGVNAAKPQPNGYLPVDGGSGNFGGMNGRFFMRGVLEFLDEPGEWCLKHDEGYVYYWPVSGTPDDHLIIRPTGERLLDIHGSSPETPVRNIAFENLSLIGSDFCKNWRIFSPGQDGSTPEPLQTGMVFGENVESLRVKGCALLAAGHSAVWLNKWARNCVIEDNLIDGAGFAGIYLNSWAIGEGPFHSAAESYINKGHRIEDNFIYDCGKYIGGGCGIQLFQSGDNLITRNCIGQMPRYGISCKGQRYGVLPKTLYGVPVTFENHWDFIHTRHNRIIGNEIFSVCRNSFDYGGIESWGPGRDNLWASNALHDMDQALDWDGWAHVLFADDASHYLTMRDNITYHCNGGALTGAFMMKSIGQVIENNLVADCNIGRIVTLEPYVEPGWDFTIRRNVFASDGRNVRYSTVPESFTGRAGELGTLPPGAGGIKEVDYNTILPGNPSDPNPLKSRGVDTHSYFGDPLLVRRKPDWDIQYADYALAPDSPAYKEGFKAIPTGEIGLRAEFPFHVDAVTRRAAMEKIQAEDYQRMSDLRTEGGKGIYAMSKGSWAKYANIDFGKGVHSATFQLETAPQTGSLPYIRRYGGTVVAATPFKGDKSVETIEDWEISKPYTRPGKTGAQLFDEVFPPERDITAGDWKPLLGPTQSRAGVRAAPGVVDFDVANGEGFANACAYARASIYAPIGRTHATITVSCASGAKVWLNGQLIIAANAPGSHTYILGVINQGWNTMLVKINQDNAPWTAKEKGDGNFWMSLGTVASGCGDIVTLPGLPTEERASRETAQTLVEMHLDSPDGPCIGKLQSTSCPVQHVSGIHNLFLVFQGSVVRSMDWFRFEK